MALSSGAGTIRRRSRKVFRAGPRVLEQTPPPSGPVLYTAELARMSPPDLQQVAADLGVESPDALTRQDLLYGVLGAHTSQGGRVVAQGTLHRLVEGFGFLRSPINSYLPGPNDVYVSPTQIRRYNLRNGDMLLGDVRRPRRGERYFGLRDLDMVNGEPAVENPDRPEFESLTPLHPDRIIRLENDSENLAARVVDLVAPIGAGQRGLIVAPPRAGKTVLLQSIAAGIQRNHPDIELMVLLVDERPEEVSDMVKNVQGEILSSTFDERGIRHIQVAEAALDRAKRRVELGKDVVILLDSLTRLARAYNHTKASAQGRLLSGGMDATAIQYPKKFFGAARNIEHGGSLTILATALVDTGSRMDDLVYEEFKGTGNMEIHLDQRLLEQRLFPAIDLHQSGTRREELLLSPGELQRMVVLRRVLASLDAVEAMALVIERMRQTASNADFLRAMTDSG
ncbi:Transcription termination factor Rho [Geodia barretti]|uniref:Transcription termination factor Rho n=4 Tax=Geodia barretti TaxID=519541 RepID=A0AA35S301_GEOBA|nr:Transcription termination factor Rho [Geodia barretti]